MIKHPQIKWHCIRDNVSKLEKNKIFLATRHHFNSIHQKQIIKYFNNFTH